MIRTPAPEAASHMDAEDTPDGLHVDIPRCSECNGALEVQLWILDPSDVALLHLCTRHGVAAISRPFS
jgi:hypothetical protein